MWKAWAAAAAFVLSAAFIILVLEPPPRFVAPQGPLQIFRDCDDCPEMVRIEPGSYRMGAEPRRLDEIMVEFGLRQSEKKDVSIAYAFAASRREITFAQWEACVAGGGCDGYLPPDEGWGRGDQPVIHVSWQDAQSYVRWLSQRTGQTYRLLSEAEWEYAARGGTQTHYPWGDRASHENANFGAPDCPPCTGVVEGADRWEHTAPVGQFAPNAFGLFDTSGNVYEWVEDCLAEPLPREPVDGAPYLAGACEMRMMRGGAWYSDPARVRSSYRAYNSPDRRDYVIGFRVARVL
jgi:formylglycine-generating enzyme required for sulfatase activity